MQCTDLVSIISSVVSTVAAVVAVCLSVFVYIQGRLHDREIDERDESRHYDAMEQSMKQFLYQYHSELSYLPLAFIAMAYDPEKIYARSLYSMLHVQNCEVQKMIAQKFGFQFLLDAGTDIYDVCYQKALNLFEEKGAPNDGSNMMYDSGKYWDRTISRYGESALIHDFYDVSNLITDVLSGQCITFEERQSSSMFQVRVKPEYSIFERELEFAKTQPVQYIIDKLGLKSCDENRCCQCMSIMIYWLAEYHDGRYEIEMAGLDDTWIMDDNRKAEDLFLRSLLAVYLHILGDKKRGDGTGA